MRIALTVAIFALALPAYAAGHAVQIKGMKFNPAKLNVAAGDTITFTNGDSRRHTATALDGSFDTGRLASGKNATVRIVTAGRHDFKCMIHPSMKGTVTAK
ncbi:cupredoxin domain-containing protein [Sinorhizobium alkalisoli]|uniref:Copper-binding protein n=1 Tax=Sinorhizobium alkalisoli TaxID=1752398 RepID=A0A1E3V7V1_9HYPH|nr:cupredoxin family copper-binding protein [Sinorhizobium alkalisoli]ODR89712.1 copper-binding protein [Sinorhizobium alkalisoli]